MTRTADKIFDIISKKGDISAHDLAKRLGITAQATHLQLRNLVKKSRIERIGSAPKTRYRVRPAGADMAPAFGGIIASILRDHPAVQLLTLFGSQARGDAGPESDYDILVFTSEGFHRQDIWNFWDRHSKGLDGAHRVSLIIKRLKSPLTLETLLLDLPEEHICLFDRSDLFPRIKSAVVKWREKNGARRIPSFGGTHAWEYSQTAKKLSDIDFNLEIGNVP